MIWLWLTHRMEMQMEKSNIKVLLKVDLEEIFKNINVQEPAVLGLQNMVKRWLNGIKRRHQNILSNFFE